MHILRTHFAMNRDDALAFATKRGFGVLVAYDGEQPRSSHVPFAIRVDAEGKVIVHLHFAQNNPLAELADGKRRFLLIVSGADAYISNDWYDSKDQVSTWLYEAVHLSGVAHLRALEGNRQHGDELLAVAEARAAKEPWTLSAMEPAKRESMLNAIRVVDIVVDEVEGQSKLNQHKIDKDHVAVSNTLLKSADFRHREIGSRMQALRPSLQYDAS